MRIETGYLNVRYLYDSIIEGKYVIPFYQREYCWDNKKIELFIDSIIKGIPIGVFQFRKRVGEDVYEVVDGLHRIRTIFNILLGKGVYFNFTTNTFTLNPNDFDYSKFINKLSPINTIHDENGKKDYDKSVALHEQYIKVYMLQLLEFTYEGTDEEIEVAFSRINEAGVAFTPTFKKVEKETILTI